MIRWKSRLFVPILIGVAFTSGIVVAQSSLILDHWSMSGFESLVEVRSAQTVTGSGNEVGRGAIRVNDQVSNRVMELGYYEYGAGIFTPSLFEFFSNGVSVRNQNGRTEPYLGVRDRGDFVEIRLRHDGTHGILTTAGVWDSGIYIAGKGPTTLGSLAGPVLTIQDDGTLEFQGGTLYVEDGALNYRSPAGRVTTLAQP